MKIIIPYLSLMTLIIFSTVACGDYDFTGKNMYNTKSYINMDNLRVNGPHEGTDIVICKESSIETVCSSNNSSPPYMSHNNIHISILQKVYAGRCERIFTAW